ncbi:MAG: hypothetical protein RDV48_24720 [Candidatus Eremiobacteraeota bacterium]|nr:hypothetical protein [Candidatus Eremiobacteraeota bacterium]
MDTAGYIAAALIAVTFFGALFYYSARHRSSLICSAPVEGDFKKLQELPVKSPQMVYLHRNVNVYLLLALAPGFFPKGGAKRHPGKYLEQ